MTTTYLLNTQRKIDFIWNSAGIFTVAGDKDYIISRAQQAESLASRTFITDPKIGRKIYLC
jgi:hypothetical protein